MHCDIWYGTVRDFCIRNPVVRSGEPLCEGCCCSLRSRALRPPEDPHALFPTSSQGAPYNNYKGTGARQTGSAATNSQKPVREGYKHDEYFFLIKPDRSLLKPFLFDT